MHSIKNREKVPKALTRFCQTGLATDDPCEDFSLLGNALRFVIARERAAGKAQGTKQAQGERVLKEPQLKNQHGNYIRNVCSGWLQPGHCDSRRQEVKQALDSQIQELKSCGSALLHPKIRGTLQEPPPSLRQGCSESPELCSQQDCASYRENAKCCRCFSLIPRAGALRNIPPTHLPLPCTQNVTSVPVNSQGLAKSLHSSGSVIPW